MRFLASVSKLLRRFDSPLVGHFDHTSVNPFIGLRALISLCWQSAPTLWEISRPRFEHTRHNIKSNCECCSSRLNAISRNNQTGEATATAKGEESRHCDDESKLSYM